VHAFKAGSAFIWSGTDLPPKHLWIVLTNPDPQTGKVVVVMVVTKRQHTDPTTVLVKGDHPFITHDSSVDYGLAKTVTVARLEADAHAATCQPLADVGPAILKQVQAGLQVSPRTVHHIKSYCAVRLAPPPTSPSA
jgi:hypothetical protein